MGGRLSEMEVEQRKRDLQRQIACLRRQIDGRIHGIEREAWRLVSWRVQLKRIPSQAMLGALGVGLALSAGVKRRSVSRWLGMRLARRAIAQAGRQLWRERRRLWRKSASGESTVRKEMEHE